MKNDDRHNDREPYAAYIGIDRADRKIDTALIDAPGTNLGHRVVDTKPADLKAWILGVAARFPGRRVAICIEQPCANLISFLSAFEFVDLYPINPVSLKRWREAFVLSHAKDDKGDSRHLAELVRERHHMLKRWAPDDAHTRKLRHLTEARRTLVGERTRLTNRLTAHLKDYFPLALEVTGKHLHGQLACRFLRKWPTLGKLQRTGEATVRDFYHRNASRRQPTIDKRIAAIAAGVPLTEDPAILETAPLATNAIAAQLDAIRAGVEKFDAEIEKVFAEHEDHAIFASLPGAGPNFGARLAAAFGTDRSRYADAAGAQKFLGVAPVTVQSGNSKRVHRRFACPKFHRQTLIEWAGQTVTKSTWARAYYLQQRAKGAKRFTALRALAYKWLRIIFRCWQDRAPYDEARYIAGLKKAGSPLVHNIETAGKAA